VTGSNPTVVEQFNHKIMEAFAMIDLGEMSYFIGMKIQQSNGEIFIGQQKYGRKY